MVKRGGQGYEDKNTKESLGLGPDGDETGDDDQDDSSEEEDGEFVGPAASTVAAPSSSMQTSQAEASSCRRRSGVSGGDVELCTPTSKKRSVDSAPSLQKVGSRSSLADTADTGTTISKEESTPGEEGAPGSEDSTHVRT